MKKHLKRILFFLIVYASIAYTPQIVHAEEALYIPRWEVNASLQETGDLLIMEDITFEFNDEFNGVYRDVVLNKTSGVSEITVQELLKSGEMDYSLVEDAKNGNKGVFTVKEQKNKAVIKIFSPSEDQVKTFRIRYLVKNVAVKYNDIGELYYKFLGTENKTPIGKFIVNIQLPQKDERNQVKIFAHGPEDGKISIENNSLYILQAKDIPTETFIEGRILFPKEFIPTSGNVQTIDKYSSILEEEEKLQDKILNSKIRKARTRRLFGEITLLSSSIGLIIFIIFITKLRRDKSNLPTEGFHGIPEDCTPAIASLISGTGISTNTIFATILDLMRKGYLKIDGIESGDITLDDRNYVITQIKDVDSSILSHEKFFIHWLIKEIGNGYSVSTKDIEQFSKSSNAGFLSSYTKWKNKVKSTASSKGYYDHGKVRLGSFIVVFSLILFILGIVTAISGSVLALLDFAIAFILFVYGITLFYRFSDYGYSQYRKWIVFKKYLLKNKPDLSNQDTIHSYDISLIYALGLGIIKKQEHVVPYHDVYSMNSWIFWYLLFVNNDNNTFKKSIDHSFYANNSSISGGSFSGGGGGGAGGGGAGGF